MIVYTVTGTVGQAGYLDIANSGDITGKNIYVNMTNRCPCACTFCLRQNGPGVFGSDSLWLEHEPTVSEVIESIDTWNLELYDEVVFCGYGEPTERLPELPSVSSMTRLLQRGPVMFYRLLFRQRRQPMQKSRGQSMAQARP